MRFYLCLSLLCVLPALCRADDLTVGPASGWQPMTGAQVAAMRHALQKPVRLLNASQYDDGGGAVLIAQEFTGEVNKRSVDRELTGFFRGLEKAGGKVLDQQPANIGPLRGISITFDGETNGQNFSGVGYVVFTNHEMYAMSIYGAPGLARTDPLVTSYLSRIRIDPSVVPGNVDKPGLLSVGGLDSYQLGYLFGKLMVYGAVLFGIIFAFRKLIGSSKQPRQTTPPPLPPPPLPK